MTKNMPYTKFFSSLYVILSFGILILTVFVLILFSDIEFTEINIGLSYAAACQFPEIKLEL